MPKYKIVTGEPVSEPDSEPIVEVRVVWAENGPAFEARNPGCRWVGIVCLHPDGSGVLPVTAKEVKGLRTKENGELETY